MGQVPYVQYNIAVQIPTHCTYIIQHHILHFWWHFWVPAPCSTGGNEGVTAARRELGKGQHVRTKPPENNGRRNIMGNISEEYEGVVRARQEGSSFLSCKGKAMSEERDRLCWRRFQFIPVPHGNSRWWRSLSRLNQRKLSFPYLSNQCIWFNSGGPLRRLLPSSLSHKPGYSLLNPSLPELLTLSIWVSYLVMNKQ